MAAPDVEPVAGGTVAVFSARSPAKESDNEDAAAVVAVDERRAVLAVADGLGGHPAGAEAAETTLRALGRCIVAARGGETPLRSAILDGFETANRRVMEMGVGAATTLAVVEIDGVAVRPYHVGDSTILIVGQRGAIRLATVSHSPVGYAVEAGLLDEAEAIHHADRHLVSNIVGTPTMHIEVGRTLRLRPRDTLLLGSDGLFDNLRIPEIADVIRTGALPEVAARLAETCQSRMTQPHAEHPSKPDDLTFVLFRSESIARTSCPRD